MKIIVIGAGIAGLTFAIACKQAPLVDENACLQLKKLLDHQCDTIASL